MSTIKLDGTSVSDYRAWFDSTQSHDWLPTVADQFADWLRTRKNRQWDVDLSRDGEHRDGARNLQVRRHEASGERGLRMVLEEGEPGSGQCWRTELLAVEGPRDNWISLRVSNDGGQWVAVPNLARYLTAALPLADGTTPFRDSPRVVHERDLPDLLSSMRDPQRRAALFVAGAAHTEGLPFDRWVRKIGSWTQDIIGVAHAYVLTPDATGRLADEVGDRAAPEWTIRTYVPGFDTERDDPRRHRIMGTQRLADSSDQAVRALLSRVARRQLVQPRFESALRQWQRRFDRLADHDLIADLQAADRVPMREAPTPASRPPERRAERASEYSMLALVRETLGVKEISTETLRPFVDAMVGAQRVEAQLSELEKRLAARQERLDLHELELDELRVDIEDYELELADYQDRLADRDDEVQRLRRHLVATGRTAEAYDPSDDESITGYPSSYDELLDWLSGLTERGICFTGDPAKTMELTEVDPLGRVVKKAWEASLVLADYVRAKQQERCSTGVRGYLESTPTGCRGWSTKGHAQNETAVTMQQWGHERVFPVPAAVDASGEVTMTEHFKLGKLARVDPRLYYFDDTARSGRVYVGYIGRHLTNTHT